MTPTVAAWLLPVLLLIAAAWDVWRLEIPNSLCALLALGFVAAALLAGLPWPLLLQQLLIGLAALVVCIGLFAFGLLGGGDGKLLAAMLPWYQPTALPFLLLVMALVGGGIALLLLLFRRFRLPAPLARQDWVARMHRRDAGVPYAPAIAAAGLMVLGDLVFGPPTP
jgi:prepilin peptidase CpaA